MQTIRRGLPLAFALILLMSATTSTVHAFPWKEHARKIQARIESGIERVRPTPIQARVEVPAIYRQRFGRLHTFEVETLERNSFSVTHRETPPPEIIEYLRASLAREKRLKYASPGEGTLHLVCENSRCNQIRTEVRLGADGPVVWQMSQAYRSGPFSFLPDAQGFAQQVINRLASDYEQAIPATSSRIEIPEE